ncbi:uncharacterized protein DSM5745_05730 [Aspergillus mulundensis]|uniref:AttH domain-containing protein n=1 Tax=Aspergillus mulundensis TaxID=1810919 RepID=A0A3D8RXZ1_9EURO|nr:Uncharacterized protein DSM5745_05730 [Aspergillus mulundensis]RDW78878.1 Uncharacterized protein DSM5745_05730 [Aspergillus mulundensis]
MRPAVCLVPVALLSSLGAAKGLDRGSPAQVFDSTTAAIKGLPVFYDISDVNLVEADHAFDSFWAVNYIRTTDNRTFFVSANAIIRNGSATQRAGILSLDDPSSLYTKHYQDIGLVREKNGTLDPFNLTMPGGQFGLETLHHHAASSPEALPPMRIFSHLPGTEFDIDLEFKAPVLLNAGLGSWRWAGGIQHQVSLPASRPRGTIIVDNTTLSIDSDKSVTWYDRQWGPTMPDRFTWFGFYLTSAKDGIESYVSIWHWVDDINGNKSFATIQNQAGVSTVLPLLNFQPSKTDIFHSKATGNLYALQYNITLMDGSHIIVKSQLQDQEYVLDDSTVGFFSGYVEVSGDFTGHGTVDIMPSM